MIRRTLPNQFVSGEQTLLIDNQLLTLSNADVQTPLTRLIAVPVLNRLFSRMHGCLGRCASGKGR